MTVKSDNTILRLQVSFIVMIILITLIAYLGARNSSKINEHLTFITQNIQTKLSLVTVMRNNARERTLALQVMTLTDDPFLRDEQWMLFNQYGAQFAKARIKLLTMQHSTAELDILNEQREVTKKIVPIQLQIADMAIEENTQKAKEVILDQALPLQQNVFSALDRLYLLYADMLQNETQLAQKAYDNVIFVSWVAGLSAVILALGTSAWITERIRKYQNNLHGLNTNLKNLVNEKTKKLQDSELKQRQIVENAIDGIISINEAGHIESLNPASLKILAFPKHDIIGKRFQELFRLDELKKSGGFSKKQDQSTLDALIGKEVELLFKTKTGNEIPITVGISKNIYTDHIGYSCFIRDISEQKRIDKLKSEFVSTVSHELRTPLTSIRGSLGLVLGGIVGEVPVKILDLLTLADNNVKRLLSLINDILDIQKIESGNMDFHFKTEDLIPLLNQSIKENLGYADQFNVSLKFESTINQAVVNIDKARISQVLANLLSNAIKFSHSDDEVTLKIEQRDDFFRVWVIDHGEGISKDFQAKLFEKFTQEDSSDTRKKGGTGLGLSIVKVILEKHESQLRYNTETGKGTKFYFDLAAM